MTLPFIWLPHETCRILAPLPGIKLTPPVAEAESPDHWPSKQAPGLTLLKTVEQPSCRTPFTLRLSNVFFMIQCLFSIFGQDMIGLVVLSVSLQEACEVTSSHG